MQDASLERLTREIDAHALDPLARVSAAISASDHLRSVGDDLVGRFVEQARGDGCSWTQIGSALGVSKQAAQQRYPTARESWAPRFRDDAQRALVAAGAHAQQAGHPYLGTEHILLALAEQDDSLAGRVLGDLDVTPSAVERAIGTRTPGRTPSTTTIGLSPRVKRALEQARREGLRVGHRCPGAEHLLLVLMADADSAASRMLGDLGVTPTTLRDALVARLGPDADDLIERLARPHRRVRRRR
jgi:hypothetical protein